MNILPISCAYVLDLLLGDPQWFRLHPVRLLGKLIELLEKVLLNFKNRKLSGICILIIVIGVSFFTTLLITTLTYRINFYLWLIVNSFIIYFSISIRDLEIESMEVYRALNEGNLHKARKKLSMIVGRDTENLPEREVVRATVECIAESTIDGIISPLFYAFLGGAPLAVVYRAVNTLDSMIGYNNEKYKEFGWASARLDDILNYLPSRISIFILPLASFLVGKNPINSLRMIFRDGVKNPTPNSAIPEAAIAGALRIQLGGVNFYNSVPVIKPLLGDDIIPLDKKHIKEAIKIMYVASILTVLIGTILYLGVKYLMK